MRETDEGPEDWLAEARLALAAAGELLAAGMCEEAVNSAFLAMVYAARAAMGGWEGGTSGWEDVVRIFREEVLPGLGLSKENQRALPIVCDLYRRVGGGGMEADPLTAAACLKDARCFVEEIAGVLDAGIGP